MGWSHTKTVIGQSQTMIQSSTILTFLGRSWEDDMHTCKTILGMAEGRLGKVLQLKIILAPSRDRPGSCQDEINDG